MSPIASYFRRALRGHGGAFFIPALALSLFLPGCAAQTKFGVEPGKPEITWRSSAVREPAVPATEISDREAKLRAAEESGGDETAVAEALYELAVARREQGNLDEAERLYRRALEICERTQGPNHPNVAAILNNLAAVEASQGAYDAARPMLERSLSIRQAAFGEDDLLTAQSMNNLALLYAAQGEAALAEPLYLRALAVFEKPDRSSPRDLEQVLENYAALLRDTGRDAEAQDLEVRARVIGAARERPPK